MVAINFMNQFAGPILGRSKIHTLRDKNRFKLGDTLQLYTGMRHKNCRLLSVEKCTSVVPVEFAGYAELKINGVWLPHSRFDVFARNDGFESYDAMQNWFMDNKESDWQGWLIAWGDASYLPRHAGVK